MYSWIQPSVIIKNNLLEVACKKMTNNVWRFYWKPIFVHSEYVYDQYWIHYYYHQQKAMAENSFFLIGGFKDSITRNKFQKYTKQFHLIVTCTEEKQKQMLTPYHISIIIQWHIFISSCDSGTLRTNVKAYF